MESYFANYAGGIERALTSAVNAAMEEQVSDPLIFIARLLLKDAGVSDSTGTDPKVTHGIRTSLTLCVRAGSAFGRLTPEPWSPCG
jgi:hypothetical protein